MAVGTGSARVRILARKAEILLVVKARVLEIEFDNGSVIQHTAVGEEIARRFLSSASPGSYYKDNIQEEFTVRRVR